MRKLKVSFNPGNVREIRSFFKGETDFLDVFITKTYVIVISNSMELYTQWQFDIVSRENFRPDVAFRVDRKKFLSLLTEGTITFYIPGEQEVEMEVKPTSGGQYNMSFNYQASDKTNISMKMEILRNSDKFVPINLFELQKSLKVLRSVTPLISVVDGYVVGSRGDVQVYHKTKCKNIILPANIVSYLLNFGDRIYGYQNFIISRSDSSIIVAQQYRATVDSDFEKIFQRKYTHKLTVNFTSVCELVKKIEVGDVIGLDFEQETAVISEGKSKFSTKFKVNDVQSINKANEKEFSLDDFDFNSTSSVKLTSEHNIPSILFPCNVMRDVIAQSLHEEMVMKIKKTWIQLEIGKDMIVLVGRKNYVA